MSATLEPSKHTKKSKKPIFISLALIVLLGISATVYALFFDLSAKETYFLAEKKTMEQTSEDFNQMFAVNKDLASKTLEEPSDSSLNLSLQSIQGLEAIDPNIAMFSSFLNQVQLNVNTQLDPEKNEGLFELKAGMGGTELVKAAAYQSDEVVGVNVPLLYDQYVYMNNNDFGKVMSEMDPTYNGPEKLDNFVKLQLESMQNQEKLKEHAEEYGKFVFDSIKDENVTMEDGVEFEGEKYRQLTLKLSEKETKELLKALLQKIRNDDELLDLYIGQDMMTSYMNSNMDDVDVKKEFKTMLEEAENALDDVNIPEGLTSVILIDNDKMIVKRDVTIKMGDDTEVINFNLSTHALRTENVVTDGKWELNLFPEGSENQEYVKVLLEMKGENKAEDDMKRDITGTFAFAEAGQVTGANVNATLTGSPEDMEGQFELSIENAMQPIPPIKGHFTRKVNDDLENGMYSTDGEFGLEMDPGLGSPINVVFDYEAKTAFKEQLKFPSVQEDGVNVAELNQQEKEQLMMDIQSRIEGLMMNGPQLPF